jgi:hypothetical protein
VVSVRLQAPAPPTVESRLHVRRHAPGASAAQASEQIFEDTGTIAFSHQP